jgi:hypothetical protein
MLIDRKRATIDAFSTELCPEKFRLIETMNAVTALELYRNKDVVEKVFGNAKTRLNMRRTLVFSEQSLEGSYLSYL